MSLQSFEKSLQLYYSWIKAHERIVLILGAGLLVFHFYSKGLNAWIEHDKRQATTAQQQVIVAQQKSEADERANKVLAGELAALRTQVALQSAQYAKDREQRAEDTKKQQEDDRKMTPSELAIRWADVLKIEHQEITTATLPDHLDVSGEAAHKTMDILEDYPRVVSDNAGLQIELDSEKSLVRKQDETIGGLRQQIVDDKTTLSAEQESHKKDVKTERDKAKRSWIRGFKIGVITGAVGGEVIRVFVFHKL
jgi:hypothetical protein